MADLTTALGATPPADFAELTPDETTHLAGALQSAMNTRSKLIDQSVEESLKHMPGLLRGTVRRALGM